MSSKACQTETLLATSTCDIQYCADCEIVHLVMGPMTLRLSKTHFTALSTDMNKGLISLKGNEGSLFDNHSNNITTLHS